MAVRVGVVVPSRNRQENLARLLGSLARQSAGEFVVVVADDGSTDGTREWVAQTAATAPWRGRLVWVGCGGSDTPRIDRARNVGAANLPASVDLLVMLDSDLLLAPNTIERLCAGSAAHPDAAVFGRVDWLPPGEPAAGAEPPFDDLVSRVPVPWPPTRVEGTLVGPELRATAPFAPVGAARPVELRPQWGLVLNGAIALERYWSVGGFDEQMPGYGYGDVDFVLRLRGAGVPGLFLSDARALHVWHPKDPARWHAEEQRNLDLLLRRHGRVPSLETGCDWAMWLHYHHARGGSVVRDAGGELWALNASGRRRLRLPDDGWLARLGFTSAEVTAASGAELDDIEPAGAAV